jgi:DnaK suppressor protein
VAKKSSTKSVASKKAGHSAAKSAKPAKAQAKGKTAKPTATKPAKVAKSAKALPVKPAPKTPGKSLPPAAVVKAAKPAKEAKAAPVIPAKPAVPGKPQLVQGSILTHGLAAKNAKANGKNKKITVTFVPDPPKPASRVPLMKAPKPAPALVNRPVPVAVLSGGKAKKNQAGLSTKELDFYRDLLLAKRRELVGDMGSMEAEALRSSGGTNLSTLPMHMADMGTDNYEQEFTLGLVEKDRLVLREINQALAKIQDGSYGICEGTGKPIGKPRLEAQPWAKYSIEYARMLEKRLIR